MAKNSIRDYSATNSSNTDIQSIDISEGCSPAGINNAIREVMADLKDVSTGAVALESPAMDSLTVTGDLTVDTNTLYVDSTNNRVGIGTSSPDAKIEAANSEASALSGTSNRNTILHLTNSDTGYAAGTASAIDFGTGLINSTSSIIGRNSNAGAGGWGGQLIFATSPDTSDSLTERMRIDSSGNVGIGTSSPSSKLHISSSDGDIARINGSTRSLYFRPDSAGVMLGTGANQSGNSIYFNEASNFIYLQTNSTERMRIDSSGKVGIGTTSISSTLEIVPPDTSTIIETHSFNTSAQNHMQMRNNSGTEVGSIYVTTTSTAYNTSSDYRLKENVTADWDATTRLKQLNPVRFNFIADADTTVDGFLAHEVQDIVPEAISGTKDAMRDEQYVVSAATGDIYTPAVAATYDDDGVELTAAVDEVIHSADVERPEELAEGQQWRETTAAVMGTRSVPDYQGIDQSKLVPLLVKTIQELEARITALEAN